VDDLERHALVHGEECVDHRLDVMVLGVEVCRLQPRRQANTVASPVKVP
jgi:hypothetical protein